MVAVALLDGEAAADAGLLAALREVVNEAYVTALLAAMLVEQGKLRWDSTVAEVFPELAGLMTSQGGAPQVGSIRLTSFSHTSGIPSDTEADDKLIHESTRSPG